MEIKDSIQQVTDLIKKASTQINIETVDDSISIINTPLQPDLTKLTNDKNLDKIKKGNIEDNSPSNDDRQSRNNVLGSHFDLVV